MTVCIAALCKSKTPRDTIVLVADRLMSFDNGTQSEKGRGKMRVLGKGWVALFAGRVSLANDVIQNAKKRIGNKLSVSHIKKSFDDAYQEVRVASMLARRGIKEIPRDPNGGISKEWKKEWLRGAYDCGLLVCGFRGQKGYILVLSESRKVVDVSRDSFSCIGNGEDEAFAALGRNDYKHSKASLEWCLCCSYEAKKFAEGISGVGTTTQVRILCSVPSGGVATVSLGTTERQILADIVSEWKPAKLPAKIRKQASFELTNPLLERLKEVETFKKPKLQAKSAK